MRTPTRATSLAATAITATAITAIALMPSAASAGMPPGVTLSDLASARLSGISFFCAVILVAALGTKVLWNYLRQDFDALPQLTYLRALSLVLLSGLLFNLILLMISGTRELMTPGAWVRGEVSYQLETERPPEAVQR